MAHGSLSAHEVDSLRRYLKNRESGWRASAAGILVWRLFLAHRPFEEDDLSPSENRRIERTPGETKNNGVHKFSNGEHIMLARHSTFLILALTVSLALAIFSSIVFLIQGNYTFLCFAVSLFALNGFLGRYAHKVRLKELQKQQTERGL